MSLRRHDPPLVVVYLPLCRSPRGEPVCALPVSDQYLDDPRYRRYVVEEVLEVLEASRRAEHGDRMQLPTLDPGAWQLVVRAAPGHPAHSEQYTGRRRYDLVPV